MNNGSHNSIVPKILSVIAAVILWFYVIDVRTTTEETTFYGIPIVINNFSYTDGLDIVSGKDFTVDVEVRGKKSDLSQVTSQDIYASVNMSGIDYAGTHKMDVDVVCLKNGVTIPNKTVSQINVNVDRTVADVVPVEPVLLYTIEEDVYEMGDPKLSFDTVRITGPQKFVDSVVKAKVEVNVGKIENNITYTGKIKLYDESEKVIDSPYIKISEDVVRVEIPVYKTDIKNIVPTFYNIDKEYEYTVTPSQVYVKGSVSAIDGMKNASTDTITETKPMVVVKRLNLPAGVSAHNADGNVVDTVRINITSVKDKVTDSDESADVKAD
jgi:YbbR domain-containing protein